MAFIKIIIKYTVRCHLNVCYSKEIYINNLLILNFRMLIVNNPNREYEKLTSILNSKSITRKLKTRCPFYVNQKKITL